MARTAAKKKVEEVEHKPRGRKKAEVVDFVEEKKKRGKQVAVPETEVDFYSLYEKALDKTEKELQIVTGMDEGDRLSSGMLVFDLVMGGGLVPAMYSISGPEQSAKSTTSFHVLKNALLYKIPMILYFDAENAVDKTYTGQILGVKDMTDIIGLRAGKNKGWIKKPRIRYYDTAVLENVFKAIQSQLNDLPDKIYRADTDMWYLVFKRKKEEVNRMKEMQKRGLAKHDPALYTESGQYWCPIGKDDRFQAIFFIDSYPALLLESIDEETNEGNALAVEAQGFSKWIKRVKGKLKKKRAILWGVNQVRLKPMSKGNPEYEPGGEALKFYSDVRNQIRHRSPNTSELPGVFTEDEPSIFNPKRKDTYHYKLLKNTKNKKGTPKMAGWMRVWVSDHKRKAHGFDPVFDVFQYLVMTKQVSGNRKTKMKINSPSPIFKSLAKFTFTWESFKALILALHFGDKDLIKSMKEALEVKKLPDIRALCAEQIASGEAFELMVRETESEMEDEVEDLEDDLEIEDDK